MTGISTRVVTDAEEFGSLAEVWNGMLQRTGGENSVYLTSEWLSTWWRHFSAGKGLNVLVFEKQGHMVGAVPLMRTEHRIGVFKIECLETVGALNCNYVWVVPPENHDEVMDALLAYVNEKLADDVHAVKLSLVPEDSTFLAALRARASKLSGLAVDERTRTVAPYIVLPSTWDEYYQSLSRNRKKLLRRYERAMEKRQDVEYRLCNRDSLQSKLSEFFDVHERRWRSENVGGCFSDPRMKDFYRDLAGQFFDREWLHFCWLSVDGEMTSASYSFIYNRKFYAVTMARDLRYSRYSVGHLLEVFRIRDAIERGLEELDFLRGGEPYKFHWAKTFRRYQDLVMMRKGSCPGLRLKCTRAFLRWCELRQYGLREMYHLRRMKKREEEDRKRMGLEMQDQPSRPSLSDRRVV